MMIHAMREAQLDSTCEVQEEEEAPRGQGGDRNGRREGGEDKRATGWEAGRRTTQTSTRQEATQEDG
eukprot:1022188-Alexandrium_andersonii.AAC.1